MGFFKNLFEKKVCDICGEEIGLLGNRKLEDGNCCKECAKKLSPWFTERKNSTVEEIKSQLAAREANRQAVANFHITRQFDSNTAVLIDENARKFMVTDARDLEKANPDVLDFDQVTACDLDIHDTRQEVYRRVKNQEGNYENESYSPRRYRYKYDFQITIRLEHPYIDEIHFSLSDGYFEVEVQHLEDNSLLGVLFGSNDDRNLEGSPNPPSRADRMDNHKYARCDREARELRELLMSKPQAPEHADFPGLIRAVQEAQENLRQADAAGDTAGQLAAMEQRQAAVAALSAAAQADPKGAEASGAMEFMLRGTREMETKTAASPVPETPAGSCPWCGSPVSGGKFCPNCGGKLDS